MQNALVDPAGGARRSQRKRCAKQHVVCAPLEYSRDWLQRWGGSELCRNYVRLVNSMSVEHVQVLVGTHED